MDTLTKIETLRLVDADPDCKYMLKKLTEFSHDGNEQVSEDAKMIIESLGIEYSRFTDHSIDILDGPDPFYLLAGIENSNSALKCIRLHLFKILACLSLKKYFVGSSPSYNYAQTFSLPNGRSIIELLDLDFIACALARAPVYNALSFSCDFSGKYYISVLRTEIPTKFGKDPAKLATTVAIKTTINITINSGSLDNSFADLPMNIDVSTSFPDPLSGGYERIGSYYTITLDELTGKEIDGLLSEILPELIKNLNKSFVDKI